MILATGFRYSFPFLPQYYDGATHVPHEGCAKTVPHFLPSDGSHVRDLHLDLFYIQDPTLAFIGSSWPVSLFNLCSSVIGSGIGYAVVWSFRILDACAGQSLDKHGQASKQPDNAGVVREERGGAWRVRKDRHVLGFGTASRQVVWILSGLSS